MSEPQQDTPTSTSTNGQHLRTLLHDAVHDIATTHWSPTPKPEECIVLFSGGVDSSVSLHLAHKLLGVTNAITVLVNDEATDTPWAIHTATMTDTSINHIILRPTLEALLEQDMPFLISTIHSFDPMALRNSVCATHALRHAASLGFKYVLTGDAADELLGGYKFTQRYEDAEWKLRRQVMVSKMHFDSVVIGQALGMQVTSPFLHPSIVDFAMHQLVKKDCVGLWPLRITPTAPPTETLTGKLPLREAFPELLSSSRRKDPQEVGCGTTLLGAAPWVNRVGYFDTRISDEVFEKEKARVGKGGEGGGIVLRDKEHLAYFLMFESIYGKEDGRLVVPGKERPNEDPCPACGFMLETRTQTFCLSCGHFDEGMRERWSKKEKEEEK